MSLNFFHRLLKWSLGLFIIGKVVIAGAALFVHVAESYEMSGQSQETYINIMLVGGAGWLTYFTLLGWAWAALRKFRRRGYWILRVACFVDLLPFLLVLAGVGHVSVSYLHAMTTPSIGAFPYETLFDLFYTVGLLLLSIPAEITR